MNVTADNATILSCGLPFLPFNPSKLSPDLHAVFIVRIVVYALTCPLVILLNILVMVAVKTKRQLRTKSNTALACLSMTDLVVGLVTQPLHVERIPANVEHVVLYLVILLPVLNSLFNPLIYAAKIRYFRVAFIQLLSRKTVPEAEELERKIFGPRQIGVIANVEQGQNRASREEDEQQGNVTLNIGYATTVRTQPQEEYDETSM
ncbi:hypothetical protein ACROYT_G033861 [Oculina patagonica]